MFDGYTKFLKDHPYLGSLSGMLSGYISHIKYLVLVSYMHGAAHDLMFDVLSDLGIIFGVTAGFATMVIQLRTMLNRKHLVHELKDDHPGPT